MFNNIYEYVIISPHMTPYCPHMTPKWPQYKMSLQLSLSLFSGSSISSSSISANREKLWTLKLGPQCLLSSPSG